jgi:hypothetical protein
MLDPKASTHVAWSESKTSAEWHRNEVLPSPDVLYAAFGPYILDGSSEPWIYKLAKQLPREARQDGGVASPSRHLVRSSAQKTIPTGSTLVVGWAASYEALTAQCDS